MTDEGLVTKTTGGLQSFVHRSCDKKTLFPLDVRLEEMVCGYCMATPPMSLEFLSVGPPDLTLHRNLGDD